MLGGGWLESILVGDAGGPWNVEPPAWAPKQEGRSGQYPDLTVRATSCYHSASKEIWLGLGLRYERVTMLNAA